MEINIRFSSTLMQMISDLSANKSSKEKLLKLYPYDGANVKIINNEDKLIFEGVLKLDLEEDG